MYDLDQMEKYIRDNETLDKNILLGYISNAKAGWNCRTRILDMVKDAVSQLRLDLKYLQFDLESTRRERDDALRKLQE